MTSLERDHEKRLLALEILIGKKNPVVKKKRKSRQEQVNELALAIEKKEGRKSNS